MAAFVLLDRLEPFPSEVEVGVGASVEVPEVTNDIDVAFVAGSDAVVDVAVTTTVEASCPLKNWIRSPLLVGSSAVPTSTA
jgi:hypothetical protein